MRQLIFSLAGGLAVAGVVWAQTSSSSNDSGVTQLPVGQVYKDFQIPHYENGQLKFTLTADEAKGITINRAETTNLKIDMYDNGKVSMTITSPKADLYVADRKMRTHSTVEIDRENLVATGQSCDFDLASKQYVLRNNVKVTIKNFDAGKSMAQPNQVSPSPTDPGRLQPAPVPPEPTEDEEKLLSSPGAYASTNAAPLPQ